MVDYGKRRGRTHGWARGGAALVALVLVGLLAGPTLAESTAAGDHVAAIAGPVEIGRGEPPTWRPAEAGAALEPGDRIRTGAGGRAKILLAAGEVRLFENSLLRLPASASAPAGVRLESGGSIFDVIRRAGEIFQVDSPEVVVSVKGTRFSVAVGEGGASVAVFRGLVGVRKPDASIELETLVREGFALRGGATLPFELEPAPEVDPWRSWSEGGELQRPKRARGKGKQLRGARTSVQRQTDEKVLSHAARKNPDVARKLRDMRAARTRTRQLKGGPPASPAPGADDRLPDPRSGGKMDFEELDDAMEKPEMQEDRMDGTDGEGGMDDDDMRPDQAVVKFVRTQFHDLAMEFKDGPNSDSVDLDPEDPADDELFDGLPRDEMRAMVRGAWRVLKDEHRDEIAASGGSPGELRPLFLEVLEGQGFTKPQAKAMWKKLAK